MIQRRLFQIFGINYNLYSSNPPANKLKQILGMLSKTFTVLPQTFLGYDRLTSTEFYLNLCPGIAIENYWS